MSRFSKKAFTLVELSVVIVIISLLVAAVLISRVLVDSARINKIQEDYRSYNASIQQFQTAYNCVPGDCVASQLAGPQFASLNSACIVTSPTGAIDNETKRTCMFHEMQLAGIMSGVDTALSGIIGIGGVGTTLTSVTALAESIAGQNMPFSIFSRNGAWDFVLVQANNTGSITDNITFPIETVAITVAGTGTLYHLVGKHILALRDARSTICDSGNYCGLISMYAAGNNKLKAAISPTLAYKLDTKFDDGRPYTGSIYGGFIPSAWVAGFQEPCRIDGTGPYSVDSRYKKSNNVMEGCIMMYPMSL